MKAYKYKLKPSRKIIAIFESWLDVLCELYNAALQERRDAYRACGTSISKSDQEKQLPEIKKGRGGECQRDIDDLLSLWKSIQHTVVCPNLPLWKLRFDPGSRS